MSRNVLSLSANVLISIIAIVLIIAVVSPVAVAHEDHDSDQNMDHDVDNQGAHGEMHGEMDQGMHHAHDEDSLGMSLVNWLSLLFGIAIMYYAATTRKFGGAVGTAAKAAVVGGLATVTVFLVEILRREAGIMILGDQWMLAHHVLMGVTLGCLAYAFRSLSHIVE